jgi:hypothetical protein
VQLLQSPEMAAELVQLRNDVTGACLARWEEEQENARLRLALESAKRGRRELRAQVVALLEERHVTNEALDDAVQALRKRDTGPAPYAATPEAHAQMRAALTRHHTTARHGTCENCGSAPESWCPDCAACEQGCFGGFDGNECGHANARWRRPSVDESPDALTRSFAPTQALREDAAAPKCRCDEPGADPYSCEADDCTGEFSELNPFGGGPVQGHDAKVSRTCETCGWKTSVWHVADGSAEEELHGHTVRVHGSQPVAGAS